MQLIGSYDAKFYDYYNEWRNKNPDAAKETYLVGEIENRKKLLQYYDRAKIFCLPSRAEAFSLALIEAASRGNYLLLSNVGSANEVVNELGYGELFTSENEIEFTDKMIKVCNILEETNVDIHKKIAGKVQEKYSWDCSCKKIYEKL